jgi:NAD/NADP transhydrogenase alpha subunit
MTAMRKQKHLTMLMAGASESGRMRVINAVMAYTKGFCKEMTFMFNKRMIVVIMALTGVVVMLINGETTHSAAKLNHKNITQEHIKEWKHSCLVIVKEI